MDAQSPKLPEIKPEVNKEREEDRKPGFWAGLLSRLAGGGGAAGGAGWGAASGLLATKAGVVGLVLVGTTVAGGIGIVSYKVFGPTRADRSDARFMSLFESRPKSAPGSEGEKPGAAEDGSSASLDYLVKANAGAGSQESDQAKADTAAGQNEQASPSATAPVGTAQNLNAAPGGKANPALKTDKKFGELSKLGGGGGGASSAAGGTAAAPGNLVASAKLGSAGAVGGAKAAAAGRNLRGLGASASRRSPGGSFRQLGAVRKDQVGAGSSAQAGATYDGARRAGGAIGPEAGVPEGGAGVGGKGTSSNPSLAAPQADNRFPAPPAVQGKNVTPWQKAINTAAMLLVGAVLLLFIAGKFSEENPILSHVLAGFAALLALGALAYGAMIAGGKYGQVFQGNMFVLAGGLIAASAVVMQFTTGKAADVPTALKWVMYISGGLGLAAAITGFLSPPHVYPPSEFQNGRAPDKSLFGRHEAPSERALKEFLA